MKIHSKVFFSRVLIIFISLSMITIWSCDRESPQTLSGVERDIRDSLLNLKLSDAATFQDSICNLQFDSLVKISYDSILENRLLEIQNLREKR